MLRGSQVESGTRRRRRRLRALPWSLDSDSESDGPEQSSFRNVVPRTEGVLPKTGPDGIPSSGQRGVSSRSLIARCGCVGGRFGPWSSAIFQEGGVAPRVIRRNLTIGSG